MCSSHPETHPPRYALRASLRLSKIRSRRFCRTSTEADSISKAGEPLRPLGHLSGLFASVIDAGQIPKFGTEFQLDANRIRSAEARLTGLRGRFVDRSALLALDALENLFTMDGNILGRIDSDAYLVAFHAEYGNADSVTDHQCFTYAAS